MTTFRVRVRREGQNVRLSNIEVETIEQSVRVSAVPGSELGMALVRGQIVPVLRLGRAEQCLIVGRVAGEVLGIAGLEIVDLEPEPTALAQSLAVGYLDFDADESPSADGTALGMPDAESELNVEALVDRAKCAQRSSAFPAEEST